MTITKEGSLASFYTVNKAPIKHLRVYFSPKQAGEGDPSPDNVREISGYTGIFVDQTSKNLFGGNALKNALKTGFINGTINDTTITYEMDSNVVDLVPLFTQFKSNTQYTFIYTISTSAKVYSHLGILYTDGSYIHLDISNYPGSNIKGTYIKTSNASKSIAALVVTRDTFSSVTFYCNESGIFEGNINIDQFEPYRGHTYNLDWSSTLGTIYGGYVDLVTGELVQEWYNVESSKWIKYNESNGYYAYRLDGIPPAEKNLPGTKRISNIISEYGSFNSSNMNKNIIQYPNYVALQSDIDIMELQYIYRLVTPITHQLTPTQLSTLIGQNNIWSNADRVEVEYDLAESNDELYRRRNIILSGYPHIETASGNIASFQTDMVAPLKEAKIYFNPIQEGSGDPSPENVRMINGTKKINLFYENTRHNIIIPDISNINILLGTGEVSILNDNYLNIINTSESGSFVFEVNIEPITFDSNMNNTLFFITANIPVSSDNGDFILQFRNANNKNIVTLFMNTSPYYNNAFVKITDLPNDFSDIATKVRILTANSISISPFYIKENDIKTISYNWTNTFGTIYGGYVDLINGEVWKIWNIIDLGDIVWGAKAAARLTYWSNVISDIDTTSNTDVFCSHYTQTTEYSMPDKTISTRYLIGTGRIAIRDTDKDVDYHEFQEAMQGVKLTYKLKTPQLITTLTPTQLKSLIGTNNIWSNANGPIEVKYWTH